MVAKLLKVCSCCGRFVPGSGDCSDPYCLAIKKDSRDRMKKLFFTGIDKPFNYTNRVLVDIKNQVRKAVE